MTAGSLLALVVDRETAREAAEQELRRREYVEAQPSLVARVAGRVLAELGELLARAAEAAPGGGLGLLALLVLIALLVAVVLTRIGPLARTSRTPSLFAGSATLTADEHRQQAQAAAEQGRWADAVRERLRAVVR